MGGQKLLLPAGQLGWGRGKVDGCAPVSIKAGTGQGLLFLLPCPGFFMPVFGLLVISGFYLRLSGFVVRKKTESGIRGL